MVWDEVVETVKSGTGPVVLAFFKKYTLPAQVVASGKVRDEAVVPVNTRMQSVEDAEVLVVNDRNPAENDPTTCNVELGEAVPIPTWA